MSIRALAIGSSNYSDYVDRFEAIQNAHVSDGLHTAQRDQLEEFPSFDVAINRQEFVYRKLSVRRVSSDKIAHVKPIILREWPWSLLFSGALPTLLLAFAGLSLLFAIVFFEGSLYLFAIPASFAVLVFLLLYQIANSLRRQAALTRTIHERA